jgi:platelet-activating factor acetylhydrolase
MPAKEEQQPFPVIVFSHGLTGCRTSYSAICSELSSHGFVVAAIEHRYINVNEISHKQHTD